MSSEPKNYAGVQWGLGRPSVILVGRYEPAPQDNLVLLQEFYKRGVYLPEMIRIAQELAKEHGVRKFFCDPSEPRFIDRLKKERLWAVAVADEENAGANLIAERLENARHKRPGSLVLSGQCRELIKEFQRAHLPEFNPDKPYRDRPVPVYNYALAALRFMVLGLSYEATPRVRWLT